MMTVSFHMRRMVYLFLLSCCVYIGVNLFRSGTLVNDLDRDARLKEINRIVQSSRNSELHRRGLLSGQACRHPHLDLHNPEIMKFLSPMGPVDCGKTEDWVVMDGSTARITDEARAKYGEVECSFTDVIRETEYSVHDGVTTTSHTEYNLEESDFVKVRCRSSNGHKWQSVLAGIRHDQEVRDRTSWSKVSKDGLEMNVLMFGFDSLSRNMFIRKLPKTYKYLHDTLEGITMEGYNIVGDGTPQALIPILTGKTELELPETRKRMGDKANFVNIYPFLWKDFQHNGYVTAYMEDAPSIGTFTYRLKGFNSPPTDHYTRPFYLSAAGEMSTYKDLCIAGIPKHKVVMNYIKSFFQVYHSKPKFLFSFHAELSHDSYNLIGSADDDMLEWLQSLTSDNHLNKTLLIVMSDHGHRFTKIRNTQQGKQEERLPFFTFVLPPWFSKLHPEAARNLRTNSHRLTTPFDIYPTLHDVLHFEGAGRGAVENRSISLFKEVPKERTCADAYIEPHWCACLEWKEVSLSDRLVERAAESLVQFVNRYTESEREICSLLHLERIQWAAMLTPNQGLLHFHKNADVDGFVADLTADTTVTQETYQVKVATQPGNGLFEASLVYDINKDSFTIKISDISRINRYGSAAHCVYEKLDHLRKYCHCKAPPPDN